MKCPYCAAEMSVGYIPNGDQPVQWIPEGKKPSPFSFTASEDGVALENRFSPIKANGYRADAHYCEKCGIVLARAAENGK